MNLSNLGAIKYRIKIDGLTNDDEIFNRIAIMLEPDFEINDSNKESFAQLKLYFDKDINYKGNLNNGVLLMGGYGNGKTLALDIFQAYTLLVKNRNFYSMYDTDEIIDSFTKEGRPSIEKYNPEYDIAIDELGQDSGKHYYYGSIDDPVDVLLSRRYKRFKEYGILTHATSNLDPRMLQERFSGKVYDRICEMFTTIPFNGESWRRKK